MVRKTWDREAYVRILERLDNKTALLIQDYGQKVEPTRNKETQTEAFGKSGISQYAATFLLSLSAFTSEEICAMLGEKKAADVQDSDFFAFTVMLYCNDAKQDWVHSFMCLRVVFQQLSKTYPHIKQVIVRSDGAGNFKCCSSLLAMVHLSKWSKLRVVEVSFSEAGGGKDLSDSFVQKQKLMIREGVKRQGGSARTAEECVQTVLQGEKETNSGHASVSGVLEFLRPHVAGADENAIPGISGVYHVKYSWADDAFEGLTVFQHEGLGERRFFPAETCDAMLNLEGLSEDIVPELKLASEKVQVCSSGEYSQQRLVRGHEHRASDEKVKVEKQEGREAKWEEREAKAKRDAHSMLAAMHGLQCESCSRVFWRKAPFQKHTLTCKEQKQQSESAQTRFALPSPAALANTLVFSKLRMQGGAGSASSGMLCASLSIAITVSLIQTSSPFLLLIYSRLQLIWKINDVPQAFPRLYSQGEPY